jgi:hypothetical protein
LVLNLLKEQRMADSDELDRALAGDPRAMRSVVGNAAEPVLGPDGRPANPKVERDQAAMMVRGGLISLLADAVALRLGRTLGEAHDVQLSLDYIGNVADIAALMACRMIQNIPARGDYRDQDVAYARNGLTGAVLRLEMRCGLHGHASAAVEQIATQAADVANRAMILANLAMAGTTEAGSAAGPGVEANEAVARQARPLAPEER